MSHFCICSSKVCLWVCSDY